jgi:hypothetical protein
MELTLKEIHFEDFIRLAWLRRQAILQAKMSFGFHKKDIY